MTAAGGASNLRTVAHWLAALAVAAGWISAVAPGWELSPDLGHSWLIPLLIAFLVWDRWAERPAGVARGRIPALAWLALPLLAAGALVLRLFLTPFPIWPMVIALFTALVAGTVLVSAWLVAGWPGVRWAAGPLLLLARSIPTPSLVDTAVVLPLRQVMTGAVAELCNLLGRPAVASGTSLHLAGGWVGIEEACSGIRSLQACALLGLFFGEWYRFRLLRRVALLGVSLSAAVSGNFGRVLFLALASETGPDAAARAHDAAGWIAMATSLVLTGAVAFLWAGRRFPSRPAQTGPVTPPPRGEGPEDAAPGTAGWRWVIAMAALLVANDLATRAWFAFGRVRDADTPQWTAQLPVTHRSFKSQPLSEPAREMLRPDRFLAGSWLVENDLIADAYFVEWTHGQVARSVPFLHNPTVCLPYAGCELLRTLPPIDVAWAGGSIRFFAYEFRRLGEPIVVAFTIWDPARGRLLQRPDEARSAWQFWARQWAVVRDAREHQPGQLLAVSLPEHGDGTEPMRRLLQSLVRPASVVLLPAPAAAP